MKLKAMTIVACLTLCGCAGATGEKAQKSSDPFERGCGYIAAAIVTHGVLTMFGFSSSKSK